MKPIRVAEGVYRGPRPLLPDDVRKLKDIRIEWVLNLDDNMEKIIDERRCCAEYSIGYTSIPLSEFIRPSREDLLRAVRHITGNKPIYVHCRRGIDRTGIVIAAYRILAEGWSVEKAYEEARELGHTWWGYRLLGWKGALKGLAH